MEAIERRGRFITIEGAEGVGKTTIAAALRDALRDKTGREVILTADPGGDPVADRIRDIILHSSDPVAPETELLLFLASRAQRVATVIRPALTQGGWVISDRYTDSTLAYQGYGRGFNLEWLRELNDFATGGLRPDLTILLDAPVEVGLRRQNVQDRIGGESLEFHRKVREGFLALAHKEPERIITVDATKDITEVFEHVLEACRRLFAP
jgi:dTMP kinase